jgi:WD40 repeat protein
VGISPDNHWLVTGSWDGTARLWDMSAKDPAASPIVLHGHESAVYAVRISPDNHWLVTGSFDRTARLWDLNAKDPAASSTVLRGHEGAQNSRRPKPDAPKSSPFITKPRIWVTGLFLAVTVGEGRVEEGIRCTVLSGVPN